MKLFTASQIRDWDTYTILNEPIASIHLMERAAMAFVKKFLLLLHTQAPVKIFCGPGNNGGDGLAIGRLLLEEGLKVEVYVQTTEKYAPDFLENEKRLKSAWNKHLHRIDQNKGLPAIDDADMVIDALFGTGLSKPIEEPWLSLIRHINSNSRCTIAVDVPSGLPADLGETVLPDSSHIIQAHHTLTFQTAKRSFMHVETFSFTGEFHVLDIGLLKAYEQATASAYSYACADSIPVIHPRNKFAHKGTYGHALCIGGSYGKLGAAQLMSRACLRTGAGLVTAYIPKSGYAIMQGSLPEAMVKTADETDAITNFPDVSQYTAVAVGPGLGTDEHTVKAFAEWIGQVNKPLVLDADALNICSLLLEQKGYEFQFPATCILTPHPKEFDRLAGVSQNSMERLRKQIQFAKKHQLTVVLKGAHTAVVGPDAAVSFNSTGNPAMATAGSGDALTGVIVSLLAQGYKAFDAAVLGVYLHGMAGDRASHGRQTLMASDLIENLPLSMYQLSCMQRPPYEKSLPR